MTETQKSGSTLARDILKYIQPQYETRFYLYVKDGNGQNCCIASSRVEDRSSVDQKLRPVGYEMVADCPAIDGVFENTEMRIDTKGGIVETNSRSPLRLRLVLKVCGRLNKRLLLQRATKFGNSLTDNRSPKKQCYV